MGLDDKLREILQTPHQDSLGTTVMTFPTDKLIAEIKQAFADEGYVRVPEEVQETWREYNRMAGYMTGQEWYERFLKEGQGQMFPYRTDREEKLVFKVASFFNKCAKRASGLGDKND